MMLHKHNHVLNAMRFNSSRNGNMCRSASVMEWSSNLFANLFYQMCLT